MVTWEYCGEGQVVLNRVVRVSLIERVTFEQRLEEQRNKSHEYLREEHSR